MPSLQGVSMWQASVHLRLQYVTVNLTQHNLPTLSHWSPQSILTNFQLNRFYSLWFEMFDALSNTVSELVLICGTQVLNINVKPNLGEHWYQMWRTRNLLSRKLTSIDWGDQWTRVDYVEWDWLWHKYGSCRWKLACHAETLPGDRTSLRFMMNMPNLTITTNQRKIYKFSQQ